MVVRGGKAVCGDWAVAVNEGAKAARALAASEEQNALGRVQAGAKKVACVSSCLFGVRGSGFGFRVLWFLAVPR